MVILEKEKELKEKEKEGGGRELKKNYNKNGQR